MKTIQDKICNALILSGWKEIESKTSKAKTFEHPQRSYLYFVGRRGSWRKGKCFTKSYVVNYNMELIEKFALKKTTIK